MTTCSRFVKQGILGLLMGGVLLPATASAQVAVGAGVDFPSLYYFRGVRQETDPKFTMQPWVDVGGTLMEGDGALKSVTLNAGSWNSIHTGSNSDPEFYDGAFYESDFYTTLGLGFGSFSLATTYTAYMYPAPDFDTIHEIAFKGSYSHMLAPYALLAIEIDDCDGCSKGTYLELGVAPAFALTDEEGGPTVTVPAKLAFDVNKYYDYLWIEESEEGFGFFSVGGVLTYPMGDIGPGTWSLKGGIDMLFLSDALERGNAKEDGETSSFGFVGFGGISFAF